MKLWLAAVLLLLTAPALAEDVPPTALGDLPDATCDYPAAALAAKAQGSTLMTYTGTANGTVDNVKVLSTSGRADLDQAAVDCISHWRFDPTSALGKLVLAHHHLNIGWMIPDQPGAKAFGHRIGIPHFCGSYYPEAAKAAHASGTTRVRFFITAEGEVRDPGIETSSGNTDLDTAALECVKTWRYRPAIKDNQPVEVPWQAAIKWSFGEPVDAPPATSPATPPKP